MLLESPQGREELQRCDVAAFLFDAQQPGSFQAARQRMLAVASAAGDALPCLFVQANEADATPQLVRHALPAALPASGRSTRQLCGAGGPPSSLTLRHLPAPLLPAPRPNRLARRAASWR